MNKKIRIYLSSSIDGGTAQNINKSTEYVLSDVSIRKKLAYTPMAMPKDKPQSKWFIRGHKLRSLQISKKQRIVKKFGLSELNYIQTSHFETKPLLVRRKKTPIRENTSTLEFNEELIITPIYFSGTRKISTKNLQIDSDDIAKWMEI